jgi:hypothetical protein
MIRRLIINVVTGISVYFFTLFGTDIARPYWA